MRNDVKLGFAIGGVLLAVLIVYVLVVPGGSSQPKKVGQATQPSNTLSGNTSGSRTGSAADGRVTLEPVTPTALPATVPMVPPPSFADKPTPKVDPFAPKADAAPDPVAKASSPNSSKSDDWNAILNQPPMLLTETPVATPAKSTAAATPSISPAPAPSAPVAPTTPTNDTSYSTLTQASTTVEPLTSTPPASQPVAGSSGQRTHRIQQGETFASISTVAYGSSKYYPAIIKANPGVDPQHLKVGMTITLPAIASPVVRPTVAAASPMTGAAGEAERASARMAGTVPLALDTTKEYRVQQGDSLYKISVKLYGKSDRAEKIYQLNKQAIGEDEHRLKVGQVLQLPEAPTNTTAGAR